MNLKKIWSVGGGARRGRPPYIRHWNWRSTSGKSWIRHWVEQFSADYTTASFALEKALQHV